MVLMQRHTYYICTVQYSRGEHSGRGRAGGRVITASQRAAGRPKREQSEGESEQRPGGGRAPWWYIRYSPVAPVLLVTLALRAEVLLQWENESKASRERAEAAKARVVGFAGETVNLISLPLPSICAG
jgi:hypothetical protein